MNKYSDEFKIKAVQMVLDGNTVKYVCRMLAIPDSRPLRDWLAHYNHGGIHQLLHKNCSYSPDFKQKSRLSATFFDRLKRTMFLHGAFTFYLLLTIFWRSRRHRRCRLQNLLHRRSRRHRRAGRLIKSAFG